MKLRTLAVLASVLGASFIPTATAHAFDSGLFSVDISSQQKLQETGNLFEFDRGLIEANTFGPAVFMSADGTEVSELTTKAKGDPVAKYGLAADALTKVKVVCHAQNPSFRGTANAGGNIETSFEDGYPNSVVYSTLGTGTATASGAFRARGDLNYPKSDTSLGTTAGAVSSGDVGVKELSGEISLPFGGKVSILPMDGEGTNLIKPPLTGTDSNTVAKPSFDVDLLSYASSNIEADDSIAGRARSTTKVDINQDLTITGSCMLENIVSALVLKLDVPSPDQRPRASLGPRPPLKIGTLQIQSHQLPGGTITEDINKTIRDDGEALYVTSDKPRGGDTTVKQHVDTKWSDPRPREMAFSATSNRRAAGVRPVPRQAAKGLLGVGKGFSATYSTRAKGFRLAKLRQLVLRVAKVNTRTGGLTLATKFKVKGRKAQRRRLPVNPFTGKGELRGLFIPVGLKVGQRFWGGIAKVVAKSRRRVRVVYKQGNVRATGSYDRSTGVLRRITERAPGGVATKLVRLRAK